MKQSVISGLREGRGARRLAVASLIAAACLAHPALAQDEPCAAAPTFDRVAQTKSEAILGGAPSRLDLIRMRQSGVPSPAAGPSDATFPVRCSPPPALARGETIRAGQPDIFGSVALPVSRTALDSQWRRVAGQRLNARSGPWAALIAENRDAAPMARLIAVNAWVNARIRYVEDMREYRTADYWAPAARSIARGEGDCEDYAIAKMQILRAMGFAADSLYLVIARDLARRADHAILAVALDGDLLVLDNETDRILRSSELSDYRPVLSFSEGHRWTHGYRAAPAPLQMASLTHSIQSPLP